VRGHADILSYDHGIGQLCDRAELLVLLLMACSPRGLTAV